MKPSSTFRKLLVITISLLITICLFLSFKFRAQDDSQVIIHVEKAGTLSALIKSKNKYSITDLTLSGNLNGTDITFIREMAGGGSLKSIKTEGMLTKLDLANANIVEGGDKYFNDFLTKDNSITDYMFAELFKLTKLVIPNNINSICNGAFSGCFSLTTFIVPKNITAIGDFAFAGCFGLKSISIPNGITSIGNYAFTGCYGLTSFKIPSNVSFIGEYAFTGCSGLQKIYCNSSVSPKVSGTDAFKGIDASMCRLYIPNDTYDDYSNADGWNYFSNIIEEK